MLAFGRKSDTGEKLIGGLRDANGNVIPLAQLQVRVEIFGLVAQVTTDCFYQNDTEKEIEDVIFNHPLHSDAALYDFRAQIGEKFTIAEIMGKEEAKANYDEAIRQGKTAALLTEDNNHSDIFEMRLGGFKPGNMVISYTYAELLSSTSVTPCLKFTYPCLHGASYFVDPSNGSITMESIKKKHACRLRFSLYSNGDFKLIGQNFDFKVGKCSLVIESGSFTQDVIVHIARKEEKPFAVIEPGLAEHRGFMASSLAMVNFLPEASQSNKVVNQELIFIVDRSGSMSGSKMIDARRTLETFLQNLPDIQSGYLFNVISFGSRYTSMWERSQPCSQSNLARALKAIKEFSANMGGTEILGPLKWVLGTKPTRGTRNVILVTDGDVSDKEGILKYCESKRESNTIFGFGIGSGASEELVNGCADKGLGLMIKSSKQLEESVKLALDVIQGDVYKDIDVTFNLPADYKVEKLYHPRTLVPGCFFSVFAEITRQGNPVRRPAEEDMKNIPAGSCSVTAIDPEGDEKSWSIPLVLAVRPPYDAVLSAVGGNRYLMDIILSYMEHGSPIHRIAARRKLLQLSVAGAGKKEIEKLSVETNVLSSATSFVAKVDGEKIRQSVRVVGEKKLENHQDIIEEDFFAPFSSSLQSTGFTSASSFSKRRSAPTAPNRMFLPQVAAPSRSKGGGMFGFLFGSRKKVKKSASVENSSVHAISNLRSSQQNLDRRAIHIRNQQQKLNEKAKDLCKRNDKKGAIHNLKKKKMMDRELSSIENKRLNLESQIMSLENSNVNAAMCLQSSSMGLKSASHDIEQIDDVLDDMCEVDESLGQCLFESEDVEEDDLLAELCELEDDCQQSLPAVQSAERTAEDNELDELALLMGDAPHSSGNDPVENSFKKGEREINKNPANALAYFQECIDSTGKDQKGYKLRALLSIVRILLKIKKPTVKVADAIKQFLLYISNIQSREVAVQEFTKLTALLEEYNWSYTSLEKTANEVMLGLPKDQHERLESLLAERISGVVIKKGAVEEVKVEESTVHVNLDCEEFNTFRMVYTATVMRLFGKNVNPPDELNCEGLYKEASLAGIPRGKWSTWVKKRVAMYCDQ